MRQAWTPHLKGFALAMIATLLILSSLNVLGATKLPDSSTSGIHPSPPNFPDTFEVTYTFSLPYLKTVQTHGLSYPVHVWYDGPGNQLRIDVFHGLDSSYQLEDMAVSIYPRIDTVVCDIVNAPSGPTFGASLIPKPLPDLTGWEFGGTAEMGNEEVLIWRSNTKNGEKVNSYAFYISKTGKPLKLYIMGFNFMTGSHFDEYILDFGLFRAGPIDPAAFKVPKVCDTTTRLPSSDSSSSMLSRFQHQLLSLLPCSNAGPLSHPTSANGVLVGPAMPTELRLNHEYVEQFNAQHAQERGYWLRLNHFAHRSQQQWAASSLGLKRSRTQVRGPAHLGTYTRVLRDEELPRSVDWRGTGADGIVKDQASCGSCWAFAAVGAMQGAWFAATGESLSLSEQQLVDCAWEEGNNGCGGGEEEPSLEYVARVGGIASEEEYQYIGQNGFCKFGNASKGVASFDGYLNVESRNAGALMEAVAMYGPLAISIDADHMDFRFYSEGVYVNEKCKTAPEDMDHAVVLVGYGTTDHGVDYWLIRNSWSKYWGEDGYVKISRRYDCGVTTDPVMAVVDGAKGRSM